MSNHHDLVLERTLDAPIDLVWKAYTDPEHLKQWFSPKPYEISECELDLRPGGIFRIRMVGPDGFDTGQGNAGCVLEVVEGQKLSWTSALGPGYRPAEMGEGCESFPMTAIITFADRVRRLPSNLLIFGFITNQARQKRLFTADLAKPVGR